MLYRRHLLTKFSLRCYLPLVTPTLRKSCAKCNLPVHRVMSLHSKWANRQQEHNLKKQGVFIRNDKNQGVKNGITCLAYHLLYVKQTTCICARCWITNQSEDKGVHLATGGRFFLECSILFLDWSNML